MVKRKEKEKYTRLAFRAGQLFNEKITSAFWLSFKGELGRVQAAVLVCINDRQRVKASEISEELNVPKQHISKILTELSEKGLVTSEKDGSDRRSCFLSLTEKGRSYFDQHLAISDSRFEEMMEDLDEREKEEFIEALKTICTTLEKE